MSTEYRHECKYRIDACEKAVLEMRAQGLLKEDKYAAADGTYLIKNLYFDSYDDRCFYENEDGYDIRAKYRIRYYGDDKTFIRLEKKSKRNGMTRKDSCLISEEQCRMLMTGHIPAINDEMSEVMKKLFTEMRIESLVPKVIVIYERKPFVCAIGNVRITFDQSIMSSNDICDFLDSIQTLRPILQKGESLMEVKWDELLPEYISIQMALDSLQRTSFSKYYLCRKFNCYGGMRI